MLLLIFVIYLKIHFHSSSLTSYCASLISRFVFLVEKFQHFLKKVFKMAVPSEKVRNFFFQWMGFLCQENYSDLRTEIYLRTALLEFTLSVLSSTLKVIWFVYPTLYFLVTFIWNSIICVFMLTLKVLCELSFEVCLPWSASKKNLSRTRQKPRTFKICTFRQIEPIYW